MNTEELGETNDKLTDDEVMAEIKKQYQNDSYCAAMLTLFTRVCKFYELEYSIDKTQHSLENKLKENCRQSRKVIAAMNKVIAPEFSTRKGKKRHKNASYIKI